MSSNLSRAEMMLLMQWADGETNEEASAKAEALVAENCDAREFVRELGVVADSIRDVEGSAPIKIDVTDSVMTRIATEQGAVVHSMAAERARRRRVSGVVAAGLALAAGVAFMIRPAEKHASGPEHAVGSNTAATVASNATPNAGDNEPEVHVSGGSGVSVFYLQDTQAAASSVVVWVSEENE